MARRKRSVSAPYPAIQGHTGDSQALPYPPQRRLHNMTIAFKNQPDILCAMKNGHLYVLLSGTQVLFDNATKNG
jgi:hypothetical protein